MVEYRENHAAKYAKSVPSFEKWAADSKTLLDAFSIDIKDNIRRNQATDIQKNFEILIGLADLISKNRLHDPELPTKEETATMLGALTIVGDNTIKRARAFQLSHGEAQWMGKVVMRCSKLVEECKEFVGNVKNI